MIVALYKVWRGHTFVEASIASIYHEVGAIVVVSSEIGWTGHKGNTVEPVIRAWAKENDFMKKIHIERFDSVDQNEQYQFGMKVIREKYPECSWVMLIDTDEIWGETDLLRAKNKYLKRPSDIACFRVMMHGYIKSPFYRIIDVSGVMPSMFVLPHVPFVGVRGNKVVPHTIMYDVYVHHMSAVREDEESVFEKFQTSTVGDGGGCRMVDIEKWRRDVWNKLPGVKSFHYNVGCEYVWDSIEIIDKSFLPSVLRNHPLVRKWESK